MVTCRASQARQTPYMTVQSTKGRGRPGAAAVRLVSAFGTGVRRPSDTSNLHSTRVNAALPKRERGDVRDTTNPTLNGGWNLRAIPTCTKHNSSSSYGRIGREGGVPRRILRRFAGPTMAAFGERNLSPTNGLRDFARSQKRYWPDGRVNVVIQRRRQARIPATGDADVSGMG